MKVTKAVIPAAGLGTRFLPITKSVPKEMLPIVDKPALEYIIDEIIESGIRDILIVTGRGKRCIEDHFDYAPELDAILEKEGKTGLLELSRQSSEKANIFYVRQHKPAGLAHAVACAESFVGDEPFALLLGDDMVYTGGRQKPCIKQLIDVYQKEGLGVIASMVVPDSEVDKYGNIGISKSYGKYHKVSDIIEKPKAKDKLSNKAIIGRYVCPPGIFKAIKNTAPRGKEVYFTDALLSIAKTKGLLALDIEGRRYDTGDKLGYLEANIEYALRDPKLADGLREIIKRLKIED